jgi:DNA polymerase III psi subunit
MYSNLTLYYLEQMGITPWVDKKNYKSTTNETDKSISLLVMTPKLNGKEQHLLNNILSFLGLQEEQLVHLQTANGTQQREIQAVFTLFFGLNLQQTPTITAADSLSYLLSNPLAKKKLFSKLVLLKEQLASL